MKSLTPPETTPAASGDAAPASWALSRWPRRGLVLLYAFAGYLFVRAHLLNTIHFLNLPAYLAGHERLPFQRRVLPMLLLRGLDRFVPAGTHVGRHGLFAEPHTMYLFLLDLISFALASYFCLRLHRAAMPQSRYRWLVFPVFLWAVVWSFLVHTIFNHYFPYDMLSVAIFAAGLVCVYERRFLWLLLLVLLGSLNKETVVFFVPLFVLDAAAPVSVSRLQRIGLRLHRSQAAPLLKAVVLSIAWLLVTFALSHFYAGNDRGELRFRFSENLHNLAPNSWPEFFGACGFLLPVLWGLRRRIPDTRIASYLLIVPLWIAVMFARGVLTETRIFGELCPLVAVASVLLLESYAAADSGPVQLRAAQSLRPRSDEVPLQLTGCLPVPGLSPARTGSLRRSKIFSHRS